MKFDADATRKITKTVLEFQRRFITDIVREEVRLPQNNTAFLLVRGKAVSSVATTDRTFDIELVQPLGQNAPSPVAGTGTGTAATRLRVVNVPQSAVSAGDTVYAVYRYATTYEGEQDGGTGTGDGNWEALKLGAGGGNVEAAVCMIAEEVDAATMSGTSFICMPGVGHLAGVLLERLPGQYNYTPKSISGTGAGGGVGTGTGQITDPVRVTVLNTIESPIRASVTEPITLVGFVEELGGEDTGTGTGTGTADPSEKIFIVASDKDIRSNTNFQRGLDQILYHEAGSPIGKLDAEVCGTGTGS